MVPQFGQRSACDTAQPSQCCGLRGPVLPVEAVGHIQRHRSERYQPDLPRNAGKVIGLTARKSDVVIRDRAAQLAQRDRQLFHGKANDLASRRFSQPLHDIVQAPSVDADRLIRRQLRYFFHSASVPVDSRVARSCTGLCQEIVTAVRHKHSNFIDLGATPAARQR